MQMHSRFLSTVQPLVLVPALLFSLRSQAAEEHPQSPRSGTRPNVIVFIVDDLGQRDLGCYGSSFYETPHIDRLAQTGVRLSSAYAACPVCSPTRASLVTGLYPQRTGITDYIGAAQPAAWKRNTRHLPAPYTTQLALEHVTIAERLRAEGYATFFGGKWHLGGDGFLPEDQGFHVNRGGTAQGGPYGGKKYFSPYGNPRLSDGPPGEHLPDRLATEAVKFMEDHRETPFLIWLPFYSVHTPLMARPDLEQKYRDKRGMLETVDQFAEEPPRKVRISQDHAIYAGMVEAMDQAVGKVLERLEQLGLDQHTLVIFTSDNGGLSTSEGSPTSNQPLRAGKGWLYEGGLRTASILRCPGRLPAGTVSHLPVISCDYVPTILDVCGVAADNGMLDGISLLPALQPGAATPARPLFWHYPHYGNQGGAPGAAVLEDGWKLIEWFEEDRLELFHLAEDESERVDRSSDQPERLTRLRGLLRAWQADVGGRMTVPNPRWDSQKPDGRQ
ncbi:MAG: sulfatase [Planctomycetota bacterium]